MKTRKNRKRKQRLWPRKLRSSLRNLAVLVWTAILFLPEGVRRLKPLAIILARIPPALWARRERLFFAGRFILRMAAPTARALKRSTVLLWNTLIPWLATLPWKRLSAVPWKIRQVVDPRVVRLEPPGRHLVHSLFITALFIGLAACAVAVARGNRAPSAPLSNEPTIESPAPEPVANSPEVKPPTDRADASSEPALASESPSDRKPTRKRAKKMPGNFYDPIYIFTDEPAKRVSAYPLKDPPGIAVTIAGMAEPEAAPDEMVGRDERISSVRRKAVSGGLRYILQTTGPIRRIDTTHEGNVIIISPLR